MFIKNKLLPIFALTTLSISSICSAQAEMCLPDSLVSDSLVERIELTGDQQQAIYNKIQDCKVSSDCEYLDFENANIYRTYKAYGPTYFANTDVIFDTYKPSSFSSKLTITNNYKFHSFTEEYNKIYLEHYGINTNVFLGNRLDNRLDIPRVKLLKSYNDSFGGPNDSNGNMDIKFTSVASGLKFTVWGDHFRFTLKDADGNILIENAGRGVSKNNEFHGLMGPTGKDLDPKKYVFDYSELNVNSISFSGENYAIENLAYSFNNDLDNDGIYSQDDNCPNIANAGQWDRDNDGLGNKCDDDIDGDGVSNDDEILAGTKVWDSSSY